MANRSTPSGFSDALYAQLNSAFTELGEMPNNLLLRCVQHSAKITFMEATEQEAKYLEKNNIARINYITDSDGDCFNRTIKTFLPPWDEIFSDLVLEMKAFRPGKDNKAPSKPVL